MRVFVGDFETTVYDGQNDTEVWASAIVELFTEKVAILHSINETFEYLKNLKENVIIYYHNLKFDGEFWLSFLLNNSLYRDCFIRDENGEIIDIPQKNKMPKFTYKYSISNMGQWYYIIIRTSHAFIEIRDSLKLLPFTIREIGKSFKTKHQKLEMEYEGYRYAGCEITDKEKDYIANDVLVAKEALEIMYNEGHKKLTIGSCCLDEYKRIFGKINYEEYFPDLTKILINESDYGSKNVDEYIRHAYKGGWTYVVKEKENKIYTNGLTLDVNSLYPSVMSSESGSYYPFGKPVFWKGNYIPFENSAYSDSPDNFFFVRIKTRFKIKSNKLPFIQLKGTGLYGNTEYLETSDVKVNGKYYSQFRDLEGNIHDTFVVITLTQWDYKLLKEHYDLIDCTILDGCYFQCEKGLFDEYINKYKKIKMNSEGAIRQLAKLFLNNLYGKMGTGTNSSFKVGYLDENGVVHYHTILQNNKKAGYIPIGAAITSYARCFTIRAAQANYYGIDKRGFIYADTDSIHCDLDKNELNNVPIDSNDFCHWKIECKWDKALFVRQKTYIEHIIWDDKKKENTEAYYNIKCAGMNDKCKQLFADSLEKEIPAEKKQNYDEYEMQFIMTNRTLEDFRKGLKIEGKLIPKRIRGGVILTKTTYEMR